MTTSVSACARRFTTTCMEWDSTSMYGSGLTLLRQLGGAMLPEGMRRDADPPSGAAEPEAVGVPLPNAAAPPVAVTQRAPVTPAAVTQRAPVTRLAPAAAAPPAAVTRQITSPGPPCPRT